jgi:hypothetical protein
MRVLVCGGRTFGIDSDGGITNEADKLFDALEDLRECYGDDLVIIEGGARGADTIASVWATHQRVKHICFKADWQRHGSAAGRLRNTQMIEQGKPDLVLAAPGGPGTRNMMQQAKQYGIEVRCVL